MRRQVSSRVADVHWYWESGPVKACGESPCRYVKIRLFVVVVESSARREREASRPFVSAPASKCSHGEARPSAVRQRMPASASSRWRAISSDQREPFSMPVETNRRSLSCGMIRGMNVQSDSATARLRLPDQLMKTCFEIRGLPICDLQHNHLRRRCGDQLARR